MSFQCFFAIPINDFQSLTTTFFSRLCLWLLFQCVQLHSDQVNFWANCCYKSIRLFSNNKATNDLKFEFSSVFRGFWITWKDFSRDRRPVVSDFFGYTILGEPFLCLPFPLRMLLWLSSNKRRLWPHAEWSAKHSLSYRAVNFFGHPFIALRKKYICQARQHS